MANKKITLKEIAEKTGVSLGTVHRAIYGKSGVGEETRQRILEEVKRSNYQIDEAASILKRSVKKIVVVLPKAQNEDRYYFRAIWKGIREAAAGMEQFKLQYQFIESEYPFSEIARKLKEVYDEHLDDMDGLITIADNQEADRWIDRFLKRGVMVVLLSSNYKKEINAAAEQGKIELIRVSHKRSGRLAGEFMSYSLRERSGNVLIVGRDSDLYGIRLQGEGLEEELHGRCGQLKFVSMHSLNTEEIRQQFLQEIQKPETLGVFACSARDTYQACRLIEEANRKTPLLMVGSDVFEELVPYYENGILSGTVCQYHWEQGQRAVRRMYEHLSRGIQSMEDVMLPSILVMRSNYECYLSDLKGCAEQMKIE